MDNTGTPPQQQSVKQMLLAGLFIQRLAASLNAQCTWQGSKLMVSVNATSQDDGVTWNLINKSIAAWRLVFDPAGNVTLDKWTPGVPWTTYFTLAASGITTLHQAMSNNGYGMPGTGGQTLKILQSRFQGSTGATPVPILSGGGMTATRGAAGVYTISFSTAFTTQPPACVVTVEQGDIFAAITTPPTTTSVTIHTENFLGALSDQDFDIIAIGRAA